MSKKNSINIWIETGYELFAAEGLEGIQVERLARVTTLNKSGYYHYFGDRESFLEHLMKYHLIQAHAIANDLRLIKNFDPDFIEILLKHSLQVIAHMQLVRNRHDKLLNEVFKQANGFVDLALLPSWAEFIGTPNNHEFALKYFEQVRDMFYSRITFKTMNHDFLKSLIYEAKGLLGEGISPGSTLKPS